MNVLLPVDEAPCSDAALDVLLRQFHPADTHVRVLHVVEAPMTVPETLAFAEAVAAADVAIATEDELRRRAKSIAERAVLRLRAAGFTAAADVRDGRAAEEIVTSAIRWPADVIVLGSHGRHGLERVLVGSVAEHVLRHAPCTVQIVRPSLVAGAA